MTLEEFRRIIRLVLQKHEREAATRRNLSALRRFADRFPPSPDRARRLEQLEQQLHHDSTLTDAAIEELLLELAKSIDPEALSQ